VHGSPTVHFLLVCSYRQGRLVEQTEFTDLAEATVAYEAAERRCPSEEYETVLVGADSIDTVRQTHGHYFRGSDSSLFSEFLRQAV